jgi:hypothetical protein
MTDWIKGRPTDWMNPHDFRNPDHVDNPYVEMECANSYEAGASAMLHDVVKYMYGSCSNERHGWFTAAPLIEINGKKFYKYRKDCPQCLNELKEANK